MHPRGERGKDFPILNGGRGIDGDESRELPDYRIFNKAVTQLVARYMQKGSSMDLIAIAALKSFPQKPMFDTAQECTQIKTFRRKVHLLHDLT